MVEGMENQREIEELLEELKDLISGYEKTISLSLNLTILSLFYNLWLYSEIEEVSEEEQEEFMDISRKTLLRTIKDCLGDDFTKFVLSKTIDDLHESFPNLKFYTLVENLKNKEGE